MKSINSTYVVTFLFASLFLTSCSPDDELVYEVIETIPLEINGIVSVAT